MLLLWLTKIQNPSPHTLHVSVKHAPSPCHGSDGERREGWGQVLGEVSSLPFHFHPGLISEACLFSYYSPISSS